ncbi:conserved domain protein [Peptoniphilus sp. oral taxon 375 str. F0436]|nr:conserved domain protein [Peptoniphilus sp. oral taxon 375 str. F0436]
MSQKHLSSDYKEYKELIKEQDQKLASLQADNIKIKRARKHYLKTFWLNMVFLSLT